MNLYKKSFVILTVLYVLFFVKTWGSVTGLIYSHDDVVYYAQTVSLAEDCDIDIKNNLGPYSNIGLPMNLITGVMETYQPIGPTLFYLPVYILVKPAVVLLSYLRGSSFSSYDPLFFVMLSFFTLVLFFCSGLFLKKTLMLLSKKEFIADLVSVFVLWGTILPIYVFRRPIFTTIPEFFLVCLFIYLCARIYKNKELTIKNIFFLGLTAGFLISTRWNDFFLLPCAYFVFFPVFKENERDTLRFLKVFGLWVLFNIVTFSFFFIFQGMAWVEVYGGVSQFFLSHQLRISSYIQPVPAANLWESTLFQIKNFLRILFGYDWGVLWTMPIILIGGIFCIARPASLMLRNRFIYSFFMAVFFFSPFYVILQWKNTGEFYGYRFLVSLLPFAAIGFAGLIESMTDRCLRIVRILVLLFCIMNFFIILPFEYTPETTLEPLARNALGGCGWGNDAYVKNSILFYFQSDLKTFVGCFSRGYLAALIFGAISKIGFDLARFSEKTKSYFTLSGYKEYVAFIYAALISVWFLFLMVLEKRNRRK